MAHNAVLQVHLRHPLRVHRGELLLRRNPVVQDRVDLRQLVIWPIRATFFFIIDDASGFEPPTPAAVFATSASAAFILADIAVVFWSTSACCDIIDRTSASASALACSSRARRLR